MTQHELAGAAGVDLKTIYNLESGTRWPIAKTRAAVSAALRWEGDALSAIAEDIRPADAGHGPSAADDDDDPLSRLEITDEMRIHLAAIEKRIELARRKYPGRALTGAMVFGPQNRVDAESWDALAIEGRKPRTIAIGIAVVKGWEDEQAEGKGRRDIRAVLTRR